MAANAGATLHPCIWPTLRPCILYYIFLVYVLVRYNGSWTFVNITDVVIINQVMNDNDRETMSLPTTFKSRPIFFMWTQGLGSRWCRHWRWPTVQTDSPSAPSRAAPTHPSNSTSPHVCNTLIRFYPSVPASSHSLSLSITFIRFFHINLTCVYLPQVIRHLHWIHSLADAHLLKLCEIHMDH